MSFANENDKKTSNETFTIIKTVQMERNPRACIVIGRRRDDTGAREGEDLDIRRFFHSERTGELHPSKSGVRIHGEILPEVLAGVWAALTPDEREACRQRILSEQISV